jgi:hypothetical protein
LGRRVSFGARQGRSDALDRSKSGSGFSPEG